MQKHEMTIDKAVAFAQSHIKNGQLDEARRTLSEILSQVPDYQPALDGMKSLREASINSGLEPKDEQLQTIVNLRNAGDTKKALKVAEKLQKQFPAHPSLITMLAALYEESGQSAAQGEMYERALAATPNNIALLNAYGVYLGKQGRLEEAIARFSKAIKIDSSNAETYLNMAVAFKRSKNYALAIHYYHQALNYNPDLTSAASDLARLLAQLGQHDQSAAFYDYTAKLKPQQVTALLGLASQYLASNQIKKAIEKLDQVIKIEPENTAAIVRMVNALRLDFDYDRAKDYGLKAVELMPDSPHPFNNLGLLYHELGDHKEALKYIEKAIEIQPDFAEGINNRGITLLAMGDVEGAKQAYLDALKIKPDYAACYRNLSTAGKGHKFTKEQIDHMEKALKDPLTSVDDRIHYHYTLASVYEAKEDRTKEFAHLSVGGKMRKSVLDYNIASDRAQFTLVKQYFNENLIPSLTVPTDKEDIRPIFILGMPRSGTSLTEQIVSSHSQVQGAGELVEFTRFTNQFIRKSPPSQLAKDQALATHNLQELQSSFYKTMQRVSAKHPVMTDKSPLNFRWVGFILNTFPNAKIVHLNRDPRAVCWSIFKHYFSVNGHGYAYDQKDLAEYYRLYLDIMDFWRQLYPGQIYDLNYERLTENQEDETRLLLEYCDLPWEDAALEFQKNKRAVRTASNTQVRKKMYTGSSDAWRKYETYLQPLIAGLGDALEGYPD